MKWTVRYVPSAENELTDLWLNATDRGQVTAAANAIDQLLSKDPQKVGESREGMSRILFVSPLAVSYDVILDDLKVVVWQVWRWQFPTD